MNSMNSTDFGELIAATQRTAVHLETRDAYFSNPRFEAWQQGKRTDWNDRASWWRPFHQQIADAVARGVTVRRARIVSEPVTEYIRWEHYVTQANVTAGEDVRWLPRRRALDVLVPVNDFWIFDERAVRVHHFTGPGDWSDKALSTEPQLVTAYTDAFEQVWAKAIPHAEYDII